MLEKIPSELKQLIQWCCWRYEEVEGSEKQTKVPYNPKNNKLASATDPQTWVSFDEAVQALRSNWNYSGIGFFFSDRDPYCGIDLDYSADPAVCLRQQQIYEAFDSYAERSPSGKGLHIIIRANIPHGRRRDSVEIYSSARYFTMTGDVYRASVIKDHQQLAEQLFSEMAPADRGNLGFYGDPIQHEEDQTIFDKAKAAANGDKFLDLYNGNWNGYYKSQSEADFALIDIISFYTQNQPQIARMFRASALGNRNKANRDNYVYPMIQRSFDNQLPPVDFSGLADRIEAARATAHNPIARGTASASFAEGEARAPTGARRLGDPAAPFSYSRDFFIDHKPPGLLQMIADYVYRSSPRPVYEISLTTALGLLSGIVGRQYNVSGAGLNQYLMLISDTGKGKEAISSGINRIVSALSSKLTVARDIVGPAEMASGQALLKYLANRNVPCFVSLTGEFGIRLQQITDPNASPAEKTLKRVLLDLYGKSGAGQQVHPSVYADREKNTDPINSPSFTLLGESTGETFYSALDEDSVAQGLLPRFIIIEYAGPRTPLNRKHETVQIPEQLLVALEELVLHCHKMADTGNVQNIGMLEDAAELADEIDRYCDYQINQAGKEVLRQLWNRVHLKTLKLAGLLAVAHNWREPLIDRDMVEWAASVVVTDTNRLLGKFQLGEMGGGTGEVKQIAKIRKFIGEYISKQFHELPKYGATEQMHRDGAIPYSHIQRKFAADAIFRKDKAGASIALKRALNEMIKSGSLNEIPSNQMSQRYGTTSQGYAVADPAWFLNAHI